MSEHNLDPQATLNQLVLEFMREQKRQRRWKWVRRIIIVLVLALLAYQVFKVQAKYALDQKKPHIGLIDVEGQIAEGQEASSDNFAKGLEKAYKQSSMKALIIRINSPGGSPVQADYMYNLLQMYKKKHPNIKTYSVCVDMCASAAYYIAAATDEIYANPSSMVGSIGVIYNGFGFVDTLEKLGVSRRVQTAGINKDFMDPFSPVKPEQQEILQGMLNHIHQAFIQKVKEGRGDRLKQNDTIFSGLLWTGSSAKELGLVDGFASTGQLARETLKLKNMVDYTYRGNVFEKIAQSIGSAAANQLPVALGLRSELKM